VINEIKKDAEQRMEKALTALSTAFNRIRTGRAHSSILDSVSVSYYGSDTPLSQVANISVDGISVGKAYDSRSGKGYHEVESGP